MEPRLKLIFTKFAYAAWKKRRYAVLPTRTVTKSTGYTKRESATILRTEE